MRSPTTLKVISERQEDFSQIVKALEEADFMVMPTSQVKLDINTNKYFGYFAVTQINGQVEKHA